MLGIGLAPKVLESLLKGMEEWRSRSETRLRDRRLRDEAIDTVLRAAINTKAYLHDRKESGRRNRRRERELSLRWQRAATAIQHYDRELFEISGVKSLGWADPDEWERSSVAPEKLKLATIIRQCRYLQDHP